MDARWAALGQQEEPTPFLLPVGYGRTMTVARWKKQTTTTDDNSQPHRRAARFSFDDLCAGLLGPSDYLALAAAFDAVFVDGVPALSMRTRDKARRLITLVDELYNARRVLVVSAAAPPDRLFAGRRQQSGGSDNNAANATDEAEPLLDLMEQLAYEGAVEGSRLRRDLTSDGGLAPVAATDEARIKAQQALGGEEERFAFARAASRLAEMCADEGR